MMLIDRFFEWAVNRTSKANYGGEGFEFSEDGELISYSNPCFEDVPLGFIDQSIPYNPFHFRIGWNFGIDNGILVLYSNDCLGSFQSFRADEMGVYRHETRNNL